MVTTSEYLGTSRECDGEYLTNAGAMPGWGQTFGLFYAAGDSEIAASGMQKGQAICAGGPEAEAAGARLLECEYLTGVPAPRGYGACRDTSGATYKLLF